MSEEDLVYNNPVQRAFACVAWIAKYKDVLVDSKALRHQHPLDDVGASSMCHMMSELGISTKCIQLNVKDLASIPCPALIQDTEHNWYVVLDADRGGIEILGDNQQPAPIDIETLSAVASGQIIIFESMQSQEANDKYFGGGWFVKAFLRYRSVVTQILVTALALQICILILPLFLQTIIDKVVVHRSETTLMMLSLGVCIVIGMESILELVKKYLLAHTTARIDARLGSKLFDKLMVLPYRFYSERSVGQIISRMNEVEQVRIFLNGATLTAFIDLMLSITLLVVMVFYSPFLAMLVMASVPVYLAVCFVIMPKLFRLYGEQFETSAHSNGYLVETIAGIETLRSMAVEPQMKYRWQAILSKYVHSRFNVTWWVNIGVEAVHFISKIVTVLVLFVGAKFVMNGELTIGQLVAFNMLAATFNTPVIRLSQLWQEFQQMRISVSRLGDILNHRDEATMNDRQWLTEVKGHIDIKNLNFRYRKNNDYSLKNINLNIKPGEVIGLVGRSGSGKSTLTKLIQGLYEADSGTICIDNHELSAINISSLRVNLGVVLQDNVLFSDSIYQNIAFSNTELTLEQVQRAACLAGAHEFITKMPEGYQTKLEERGSNLSGGQRQRIAIARAIVNEPKILILDEATSALDYESERLLQANLKRICSDKTVIIVAHRLSTVRYADRIVVMDDGEIIEQGSHEQLITMKGRYADLHAQQS
ncbi:type I secretion system permease/ATPase [Vibrio mimicus]|uniref:peptidase domain-containing ABC transporter n=1 Tax=Vibrio mimicus TaxID=674 RepID=UPI002F954A25